MIVILDDEKIIDLYWERSENAISETDKKYRSRCLAVANNILHNMSDSEECLNDTYMTAWNTMPPERPSFLAAFLCRIIKNLSLKKYSYLHREKRNADSAVSIDELSECVSDDECTEESYDVKELTKALNEFLMAQTPERRVIFVRRYWFYDSLSQIAEQCGITENKASVTISRMRQQLRKYLEERGLG